MRSWWSLLNGSHKVVQAAEQNGGGVGWGGVLWNPGWMNAKDHSLPSQLSLTGTVPFMLPNKPSSTHCTGKRTQDSERGKVGGRWHVQWRQANWFGLVPAP